MFRVAGNEVTKLEHDLRHTVIVNSLSICVWCRLRYVFTKSNWYVHTPREEQTMFAEPSHPTLLHFRYLVRPSVFTRLWTAPLLKPWVLIHTWICIYARSLFMRIYRNIALMCKSVHCSWALFTAGPPSQPVSHRFASAYTTVLVSFCFLFW